MMGSEVGRRGGEVVVVVENEPKSTIDAVDVRFKLRSHPQ